MRLERGERECGWREVRESAVGQRSTPFFPSKADRSCNMRGESSSSSSSSSTLGSHGTCLTELMSSLSRLATLHTN